MSCFDFKVSILKTQTKPHTPTGKSIYLFTSLISPVNQLLLAALIIRKQCTAGGLQLSVSLCAKGQNPSMKLFSLHNATFLMFRS
jgi:hypothetical protein